MRKVILSVLVTLAVAVFAFAGCKKSQPTTEKPTVPPVEKPAEK